MPLDVSLELAREAEELAKEAYGRNAVVFTEAHGTGQMRRAGAKWEAHGVQVVEILSELQGYFARKEMSSSTPYDIQELVLDLAPDEAKEGLQQAFEFDLRRLIIRRITEAVKSSEKEKVADRIVKSLFDLKNADMSWKDIVNWLILVRFLAQSDKQKAQERGLEEAR